MTIQKYYNFTIQEQKSKVLISKKRGPPNPKNYSLGILLIFQGGIIFYIWEKQVVNFGTKEEDVHTKVKP